MYPTISVSEKKSRRLPLALDVDPWMASGREGARYSLASARPSVCHCPAKPELIRLPFRLRTIMAQGPVPDAGHYSSTVLVDMDRYTFDDDLVRQPDRQAMSRRVKLLYLHLGSGHKNSSSNA